MINSLYELDAWCTSIVGRFPNGTAYIARNLDFYFANESRRLSYIGRFYRGEKYLFESMMFAGMTSVFTGIKPQAFAISLNERTSKLDELELVLNLERLISGFTHAGLLMRDVLTHCPDYACAKSKIEDTQTYLVAGAYFIIAGLTEGVVITRDALTVINETSLSPSKSYLVQTNQDHFAGDCPIRCAAGNERMQAIGGSNLTKEAVQGQVMEQWPNLNFMTIFSAFLVPVTGYSQVKFVQSQNDTDPGDLI